MKRSVLIGLQIVGLLFAFSLGGWFFSADGDSSNGHGHLSGDDGATVWTCSMHPQVRADEAGACPLCGMDLIPASSEAGAGGGSSDRVVLSPRAMALAKLQTTLVSRQGNETSEIRLLGQIEPDETTRKNITAWVSGRIDKLNVNATGEVVGRGQTVASLYSPEVYTAHQDLLTAKRQVAQLPTSQGGELSAANQASTAALEAARSRLRLLGLPTSEIARMEASEKPTQTVRIRTPFAGTVIERLATEGSYVTTGSPLYRVADLNRLWVQLDAYESDLPRLATGQSVTLQIEGQPSTVAKIDFIDPTIDPQRRTAKVRVIVDNPDGLLRPGMFADALVVATAPDQRKAPLVIPVSAALFTGRRSVVYVQVEDEGQLAYEPRTVRLGPRLGDTYPVVAGLTAGERVVSRGAFAIDADLQITGGNSMMTMPDDDVYDALIDLAPGELAKLAPVVDGYLGVQRALAEDELGQASEAAHVLASAATDVQLGEAASAWGSIKDTIVQHAKHVAAADQIEDARLAFEPLSAGIERLLRRFGNPLEEPLHVAFCPMAKGDAGAKWVQQGTTIDNAYFGSSMRTCGEIKSQVSPGMTLAPGMTGKGQATMGHQH